MDSALSRDAKQATTEKERDENIILHITKEDFILDNIEWNG